MSPGLKDKCPIAPSDQGVYCGPLLIHLWAVNNGKDTRRILVSVLEDSGKLRRSNSLFILACVFQQVACMPAIYCTPIQSMDTSVHSDASKIGRHAQSTRLKSHH